MVLFEAVVRMLNVLAGKLNMLVSMDSGDGLYHLLFEMRRSSSLVSGRMDRRKDGELAG
jgi:hypothetical protein